MKKLVLWATALAALPAGALFAQNITGTWQGSLQSSPDRPPLRVVIKISRAADESLKAVLYSIDQGGMPISASAAAQQGSTVKIAVPAIGGSYEGKLSADGNSIAGTWTQVGPPLPLNLARATPETAWKIPDLPPVDAATRARVIDGAIANLNEFYVFPETAKKMEDALRAHRKKGEYDAVNDGYAFAALLTEHLREISHDKHLRVDFSPMVLPKDEPGPDRDSEAQRTRMERDNCAFEKVERYPSNIGYLKFNAFLDPAICGPTVVAAMNFLAHVDAIIFDLRDNGGGEPDMIAFISTYLFGEQTHLNDLYNRKEDSTTQYWTMPYVPGKRLTGKPVFVLTSRRTFSGAEEFTYNLKNLKRATIVGETTGGGAHPVAPHRLDDRFMIGVPFARAVNPISKTNWEGTGVEPDVKVPAADALDAAKKMAMEQIKNGQPDKK
jgi:hypothetical protein